MDLGWLGWPVFLLYGFLFIKAYAYLRDQHGTDGGSWLEGFGAFYLAPVVAAFMPVVWLNRWVEQRRDTAQIRSGGGPLTEAQRRDQRSLVAGGLFIVGVVALVLYLLLGLGPQG